ncbi:MAG TPA: hypothetical protein VK492_08960 [Chitinophagaceae bacterium]|nr:hypothetical protein [Chitinophagaceae bacterium]
MILPSDKQIKNAKQESPWDFGNKILYNLCKKHYSHKQDQYIITKVLFIGRIYAAAIERRKIKKKDINDNFYIHTIVPKFKKSRLDYHLNELKKLKQTTSINIQEVLQTHGYLTSTLKTITDLDKRSFVSKYLHFHLPEFFFIYDSRAATAIRQFCSQVPKDLKHFIHIDGVDTEYAKFFCKCFELKKRIKAHYKISLTPRQLDRLLIESFNKKNGMK